MWDGPEDRITECRQIKETASKLLSWLFDLVHRAGAIAIAKTPVSNRSSELPLVRFASRRTPLPRPQSMTTQLKPSHHRVRKTG